MAVVLNDVLYAAAASGAVWLMSSFENPFNCRKWDQMDTVVCVLLPFSRSKENVQLSDQRVRVFSHPAQKENDNERDKPLVKVALTMVKSEVTGKKIGGVGPPRPANPGQAPDAVLKCGLCSGSSWSQLWPTKWVCGEA